MPTTEQIMQLSVNSMSGLCLQYRPTNSSVASTHNTFRYKNDLIYVSDMSRSDTTDRIVIKALRTQKRTKWTHRSYDDTYHIQYSHDHAEPILLVVKREDEEEYQELRQKYRNISTSLRRTLVGMHFFNKYQPSI